MTKTMRVPRWTALVLALAVLVGFLAPITTVHAEWEEHLWLRCDDDGDAATREVEEGEDYRVEVRAKHETTGFPIKVYWYTDAGTADEKDYPGMNGVGQAANRSQNSDGRMGRDLQTTEDSFSRSRNNSPSVSRMLPIPTMLLMIPARSTSPTTMGSAHTRRGSTLSRKTGKRTGPGRRSSSSRSSHTTLA